ncbi:MAG: hypothetical protein IV100_08285 [Myxococcales bacterium]|nr:hypothetical protein [Myxococcales bacterium]
MTEAWRAGLRPEVLERWATLVAAARQATPASPLPAGVDAASLQSTVMTCAEAKGFVALMPGDEQGSTTVAVATKAHHLTPHFAAIGVGRVDGWAATVLAIADAEPLPLHAPPTEPIMPAGTSQTPSISREDAAALQRAIRAAFAVRVGFRLLGDPAVGLAIGPEGATPPLDPSQGTILQNPQGATFVYLPFRMWSDVITVTMLEQGLVTVLPSGDTQFLVPIPSEIPAWSLIETLADGGLPSDVHTFIHLIVRLFGPSASRPN